MAKSQPQQLDIKKLMLQAPRDPRTAQLYFSIALQRAQLEAQGGKAPGKHPSILSRVFDVVSRPNYAVAGMFNEVVKKIKENQEAHKGGNILELPGLLTKGAVGGLEGKNKVRFADVFSEMGMPNKFGMRGIAGFAADVTTDPLNFIAPGFTKAGDALEAERAVGGAIQGARGLKAPLIEAAGASAKQAASTPGRISLDILGRPVVSSELAYRAGSAALRPIAQTDAVQTLSQAFRTAHQLPGRLKDMYRITKIGGAASYNDWEKEFMREVGGQLTKAEGTRISHAINQGLDLTGQLAESGYDLGKAQKHVMSTIRDWDLNEIGHGIHRPGQLVDQYVPHKYPSKLEYDSDIAKKFRSEARAASVAAKKGTPAKVPTLTDLKSAGLHPHENIVDIVRLRAADHWREISKADFHRRTIETFGQDLGGKGSKQLVEAAKNSGWKKLTTKTSPQVGSPLVMSGAKEVWVPKQVFDTLELLDKMYASDEVSYKFLKLFDNMQRIWKTGVTTPNPSHHIRNMIGDSFLNFEAGVTSPVDYGRAMRIIREKGSVKIGDMVVDSVDMLDLYKRWGGASGFFNTDLVGGGRYVGTTLENPASKLNRGMEVLRHVTSQREDFMRLANFSNYMVEAGKKLGKVTANDLEELAAQAAKRVRKFNFDYGDLTDFESNFMRRVMPFYTFMRKNLPLQLEMLVFHPNKISRVPQGFAALQNMLGTDAQHMPITEQVPQYIQDLAGIRLRGEGSPGSTQNALYMNLALPVQDISQTFSGSTSEVVRKLLGQTTPALKAPIELGLRKSLFSGAPIYQGPGGYALDQFAPVRLGRQMVTGGSEPHSVIDPNERGSGIGWDIANLLTGLGIKEITPQVQRSELKRQQDPIQARLRQARTRRINRARGVGGRRR